MNMPLLEYFNYAAMMKTIHRERAERIKAASKGDIRGYIAAMISEMLP